MAMKLSTGNIAFPIEFDNGHKDIIYFNPSDPNLPTRLMDSESRISERINSLTTDDVALDSSGNAKFPTTIEEFKNLSDDEKDEITRSAEKASEIIKQTNEIICEEIDNAFNGDISSVVFQFCSPLAIVNGEYMVMQFINAITPEIQKEINKGNKSLESKMSKYVDKYKKR